MVNRFKKRALSYSQLSSFEYDKKEWYKNYILGIREPANPAMEYGNFIGDRIGTLNNLVTGLEPAGTKEFELRANLGTIPIVGYADHYCSKTCVLNENKTSATKNRWTQKKVDEHSQLTMYCLMLFLQHKVKPEDVTIYLNFIPVRTVGFNFELPNTPTFQTFQTKRTTFDIVKYAGYIQATVKEMDEYILCQSQ